MRSHQPPSSTRDLALRLALVCVAVAAVAIVSFLPGADKRVLHTGGRLHSWGHLIAFTVVGYVAGRISRSLLVRILVFLGALIFGLGIEVGEHLVFHNTLEWKDVVVDTLGVIGGTLIAIAGATQASDSTLA